MLSDDKDSILASLEFGDECKTDCHPKMALASITTMGLVTFKFDRDMKVPPVEDLMLWRGSNYYFIQNSKVLSQEVMEANNFGPESFTDILVLSLIHI